MALSARRSMPDKRCFLKRRRRSRICQQIVTPMRSPVWRTRSAKCSNNFEVDGDSINRRKIPRNNPPALQSRIREMPEDERPREKLAARGASAPSDAELIAIVLLTGVYGRKVDDLCGS